MVEAKKDDPASADEVWENIMVGNKAAAESTEFLLQRGVTHLLNLAADRSLRFHVTPDKVRCSMFMKFMLNGPRLLWPGPGWRSRRWG